MNNKIVDIDSVPVINLLELFKGEMLKLDGLVDKLSTESSQIKNSWQGTGSDSTASTIEVLKKMFEEIKTKNESYVKFVDSTINKYKAMDNSQLNFVDTSKGSFDTSLYGGNQG